MKNTKISMYNTSLLVGSIFLQSFSFLSIKYATIYDGFYSTVLLLLAFLLLGIRAIIWQILLRFTELSKVYPYASLVQILILIYSVVLFHETVTLYNIIGLIIILSGIYYISKENANE